MQQETTWIFYFKRMSRHLLFLMVWLACNPINHLSDHSSTRIRITFTYVNDTDHKVIISNPRYGCGFDEGNGVFPILPHDTLVLHRTNLQHPYPRDYYQGERLAIDDVALYNSNCKAYIKIDSIFHCVGYSNFGNVLNYEDRKELPNTMMDSIDTMFGFTYRFTQQKIDEEYTENAEPCD